MTNYTNYKILSSDDPNQLEDMVNYNLNNGYTHIGGPFSHGNLWNQAVAKPIVPEVKGWDMKLVSQSPIKEELADCVSNAVVGYN